MCRKHAISQSYDFMFAVDSVAMLDHAHTLWRLIESNRSDWFPVRALLVHLGLFPHPSRNVIAPLLVRPHRMFSNFWGDIASNGFYARSNDYQLIVEGERR